MIYGISGKKQVGKDTTASFIQEATGNKFRIVKFADKLKDTICLLTGCTREQLEDEDFKNSLMPEEWTMYRVCFLDAFSSYEKLFATKAEFDKNVRELWVEGDYTIMDQMSGEVRITYRQALQVVGTDLLRKQFHPKVWVNATMRDIKENEDVIITDVRFPDECKAIEDAGGIVIRIERKTGIEDNHPSETALDDYEDFDYRILNNNTLEELKESINFIIK